MELLNVFLWEESEVFERVTEVLKEPPTITDGKEYAYWNRKSPIIVQSHIDIVEGRGGKWDKTERKMVTKDSPREILRSRNVITSKSGILGGDDRAGIMAILQINAICKTSKIPLPNILLTNGEESGGRGMKEFLKIVEREMFAEVRLILGLDRRGVGEYVYYIKPDDEVKHYIESFGFVKDLGSYSDSKDLSRAFDIPSVNLSVGYYDNHSSLETVHIDEVLLTAKRVCGMLRDPIDKRYGIEAERVYPTYAGYNNKYASGNYTKADDKNNKNNNFSASERRRKRCTDLMKNNNLPVLCTHYPYLDYLLTNEDIRKGFHVISTVDSKGKSLEDWSIIFNGPEDDGISQIWRKYFKDVEKLYVKSSNLHRFYLAVKIKDNTPHSATCEELAEKNIISRLEEKLKEALAAIDAEEEEKKNSGTYSGYCLNFSSGNCVGGCHGDRAYCVHEGGPLGEMVGMIGWG